MRLLLGIFTLIFLGNAQAAMVSECWEKQCLKEGWTTSDSLTGRWMADTKCQDEDCRKNGWFSRNFQGRAIYVECKGQDCFSHGQFVIEAYTHRLLQEVVCHQNAEKTERNCLKYGWTTYESGMRFVTTCDENDCEKIGGRTNGRPFSCQGQGCFVDGWISY